jgi:hypothetical protein
MPERADARSDALGLGQPLDHHSRHTDFRAVVAVVPRRQVALAPLAASRVARRLCGGGGEGVLGLCDRAVRRLRGHKQPLPHCRARPTPGRVRVLRTGTTIHPGGAPPYHRIGARYRRSRGVERQQLKWFASSSVLVALGSILISVVLVYFAEESFRSQIFLGVLFALTTLALCGIPISLGVAILRFRLYEIDFLINRTLVYAVLTATLVAVYVGGVTITQAILRALIGQREQPQFAIVVSTLVIAALFTPLRQSIQSYIDKRFYRMKYDARKTLEAFSAQLRQETDLNAMSAELVGVVRETMEPAHVSLWLHSDTRPKDEQ